MHLVDDRTIKMLRWNQVLCLACVLMAVVLSVLTGFMVVSVWADRKAHVEAIQHAQKVLEDKDRDLSLARGHVAYLDKFVTQFHKDGWHMRAVKGGPINER